MYKITIVKIETQAYQPESKYEVIDQRPLSEKEISDMAQWEKDRMKNSATPCLKNVMGYVTPPKAEKQVEIMVLNSVVDNLDLSQVIKAVHQIK